MASYTQNVNAAVAALTRVGIELPKEIADLQTRNALDVNLPTTAEAEALVANARDQKSLDAGVLALVQALALEAVDTTRVHARVRAARSRPLSEILSPLVPGLYEAVAAEYRKAAEPFTEAVNRIPDLTGLGPADVPAEAATALQDARTAVARLNAAYAAYNALLIVERTDSPGWRLEDARHLSGARTIVARLGDFSDDDEAQARAVELTQLYARRDPSLSLGSLSPHVGIVRAGGRLDLVAPDAALSREND